MTCTEVPMAMAWESLQSNASVTVACSPFASRMTRVRPGAGGRAEESSFGGTTGSGALGAATSTMPPPGRQPAFEDSPESRSKAAQLRMPLSSVYRLGSCVERLWSSGPPRPAQAGVGRAPGARTEGSTPGHPATYNGGASRPAGTGLPAYKRLQVVLDEKSPTYAPPTFVRVTPAELVAVGDE